MNRRGFLTRIGGAAVAVGTAGAIATQASPAMNPDDFMHAGYRVKWRDFHESSPTTSTLVGFWRAKHESLDLEWASTTLGQCYPSRAWEQIDLSRANAWPVLTVFSTDAERAAVKQRAKDALLTALDRPTPVNPGRIVQVDPGIYRDANGLLLPTKVYSGTKRSLMDSDLRWDT